MAAVLPPLISECYGEIPAQTAHSLAGGLSRWRGSRLSPTTIMSRREVRWWSRRPAPSHWSRPTPDPGRRFRPRYRLSQNSGQDTCPEIRFGAPRAQHRWHWHWHLHPLQSSTRSWSRSKDNAASTLSIRGTSTRLLDDTDLMAQTSPCAWASCVGAAPSLVPCHVRPATRRCMSQVGAARGATLWSHHRMKRFDHHDRYVTDNP